MVFVCVYVCLVYYLNLLSAQHCHFSHVPERLKQVVVELGRCLQQSSIRLVLLRVNLQQLHHAVHGFVFVQYLHQKHGQKRCSWCSQRATEGARNSTAAFKDKAIVILDKFNEKTKSNVFLHSNQTWGNLLLKRPEIFP